MSLPAPPDDPIEREFVSLARKLRAARSFCFVVFFVEDPRASWELRRRLGSMLDQAGRRLAVLAADSPDLLVASTLGGIFDAARASHGAAPRPVVWAEAFRGSGDAAWDAPRRLLLMRLNERRGRLESELAAPLILLLPFRGQHDAASYAPDLWHVRLHSAPLTRARTGSTPGESLSRGMRTVVAKAAASDASLRAVPKEVAYWEAQLAAALRDRAEDERALDALPLRDGVAAVHAWLRADRPDRAVDLAERLVAMARDRAESAASSTAFDPTLAVQELGIALREHSGALARNGQADAAAAALLDGVAVARAALDAGNAVPAATHLLSSLLSSLGDVERVRSRPDEARVAYQESLALLRRLPSSGSGSSQAAAVLLGSLGEAALMAADLPAALSAYRESIELWRALLAGEDDPAWRRSLALAETRLADAEWDDGQGERALRGYLESASLLRQLLSVDVGKPQALVELAAVLTRIGHVEQASGRVDAAIAACEEVLDLCRRARALGADIAGLLTDLAGPLQRLAEGAAEDMRTEQDAFDAEFATFITSFPDSPGASPDPTALIAATERLLAALRRARPAPK